jgi:hypothetical protein
MFISDLFCEVCDTSTLPQSTSTLIAIRRPSDE